MKSLRSTLLNLLVTHTKKIPIVYRNLTLTTNFTYFTIYNVENLRNGSHGNMDCRLEKSSVAILN